MSLRSGDRRARWLLVFWLALGVVVWNAVFDALVARGVKEYLFRQAAHDAGRGDPVTMREVMDQTIPGAVIVASAWTLIIAGAGILTVIVLTYRAAGTRSHQAPGTRH